MAKYLGWLTKYEPPPGESEDESGQDREVEKEAEKGDGRDQVDHEDTAGPLRPSQTPHQTHCFEDYRLVAARQGVI